MKLTKDNSEEITLKMSETLDGKVLFIGTGIGTKVEYRLDKNGLNNNQWLNDLAKQKLPVKVSDIQIMWSTGYYSYSIPFHRDNDIVFPSTDIVSIALKSPSGNDLLWKFIKQK